jgi:hypothetical protein
LGRLRWLGHLTRANEISPCRKLTFSKPEGTRRVGRPSLRWLDSVEKDLGLLGIRGWKTKALDRNLWRRPRPTQGCSVSKEEEVVIQGVPFKMQPNNNHVIQHKNKIRSRSTSM